LDIETIDVKHW